MSSLNKEGATLLLFLAKGNHEQTPMVWRELYLRDHGAHHLDSKVTDWKEEYRTAALVLNWDADHVDDDGAGASIFPRELENKYFYRDNGKSCCPKVSPFLSH